MKTDWTNEFTLKFLELYEGERILWDPTDRNHKLKHKNLEAWGRISEKLGFVPIGLLKSKKKSLMATFRPLLKRKKASLWSGADADEVFQPIWFAFDVMENFLGNMYDDEETFKTEDQDEESENKLLPPLSPSVSMKSLTSQYDDEMSEPPIKKININCPNLTKSHIGQQKPTKKTDASTTEGRNATKGSFETYNNQREDEDECDLYGKLLAKKLRKYPETMRDRIMYKIDGLLLDNPPYQKK